MNENQTQQIQMSSQVIPKSLKILLIIWIGYILLSLLPINYDLISSLLSPGYMILNNTGRGLNFTIDILGDMTIISYNVFFIIYYFGLLMGKKGFYFFCYNTMLGLFYTPLALLGLLELITPPHASPLMFLPFGFVLSIITLLFLLRNSEIQKYISEIDNTTKKISTTGLQ